MSDPAPLDEEDQPLDPALERVRRKMLRLLAVSIGIMLAGVMAVLFAVVWQINADTSPSLVRYDLAIPAGLEVQSVTGSETRITVLGVEDGQRVVLLFDAETGAQLSEGRMVTAPVDE